MNALAITFLMINAALLLFLPRKRAPLPLLVGACYMTLGPAVEFGPFTFTVIRLLVVAGFVRIIAKGERLEGGMNALDWLMVVWAAWALISSVFHPSGALILRLGLVYNACGIYFLLRVFCRSLDDAVRLCRITVILLVPVAVEMLYATLTLHNFFSVLGGVPETTIIRAGTIRAQGPFSHPILAGTIGAVCLPFAIALWRQHRKEAIIGIGACSVMIFASGSSGPMLSAMAAIAALFMWRYRNQMRFVPLLLVVGYIALDLVMKAPAYYIIAHIDMIGASTGWHRARLIQSAIEHLPEWWLSGADYTRHWMPSGVPWSPDHSDITNYYLKMGIWGGLPLMLLFIAILIKGFSFVGQALRQLTDQPMTSRFMLWALGASLFAHAVTLTSISYFDQSFLFIYLTLAAIGSSWSFGTIHAAAANERPSIAPTEQLSTTR